MAETTEGQGSEITLEQLQEKVTSKMGRWKWVVLLGVILIAGPIIWALFYAMLGVAALGAVTIGTAIGLVIFTTWWPGFVERRKNQQLKDLIEEWNRNPIESLWNAHKSDKDELDKMSTEIAEYDAAIETAKSETQKQASNLTEEDLEGFAKDIEVLEGGLADQQTAWNQALADWKAQGVQIKRAETIWKLSGVFDKANQKSGRRDEVLLKIKKETSLDAVTAKMNQSKATVRQRIRERALVSTAGTPTPTVKQLAHTHAEVIDVVPVTDKLLQGVPVDKGGYR